MTHVNLSRPAKAGVSPARRDHSVAVVVVLMMTLVFAPVVGMHVAASVFGSDTSSAAGGDQLNTIAVWPHMFTRSPG